MKLQSAKINGFKISVCGVDELPDFEGKGVTHLVSIWDGDKVDEPAPRLIIATLFPRARAHFGFFNDISEAGGYCPGKDALEGVLDFTKSLGKGDYLVVHCAYGISRSTALAFAVLCQHSGPGNEGKSLEAVAAIRTIASPNPLLVRFADEVLGRAGAMHGALKTWRAR